MADDLDDLLNEVEDKYLEKDKSSVSKFKGKNHNIHRFEDSDDDEWDDFPAKGYAGSNSLSKSLPHRPTTKGRKKSDIDALIDELDEPPCDKNARSTTNKSIKSAQSFDLSTSSGTASPRLTGQTKCFPIWIGGSTCPQGLATTVHKRCCDELRCTDCDFKVSSFDNYQWHSSTDYLFLRNNMPDLHRLKPKLVHKNGSRAYACQCQWKSIKDLANVESFRDIKWVCGKH